MAVGADYLTYVLEQLAGVERLAHRRMFGGVGFYSGERFFGLVHDDTLYFKADATNAADYQVRGMRRFMPAPKRPEAQLGYYEVPADVLEDAELLVSWARKAIAVAANASVRKCPQARSARRKRAARGR